MSTRRGQPQDHVGEDAQVVDLLTRRDVDRPDGRLETPLEGYGVRWVRLRRAGELGLP